jgi:hypothetical protein
VDKYGAVLELMNTVTKAVEDAQSASGKDTIAQIKQTGIDAYNTIISDTTENTGLLALANELTENWATADNDAEVVATWIVPADAAGSATFTKTDNAISVTTNGTNVTVTVPKSVKLAEITNSSGNTDKAYVGYFVEIADVVAGATGELSWATSTENASKGLKYTVKGTGSYNTADNATVYTITFVNSELDDTVVLQTVAGFPVVAAQGETDTYTVTVGDDTTVLKTSDIALKSGSVVSIGTGTDAESAVFGSQVAIANNAETTVYVKTTAADNFSEVILTLTVTRGTVTPSR